MRQTFYREAEQLVNKRWISTREFDRSSPGDPCSHTACAGLTHSGVVASNTRLFADRAARRGNARERMLRGSGWGASGYAGSCVAQRPRETGPVATAKRAWPGLVPAAARLLRRVRAARGFVGNKENHGYQTHFSALRGQTQADARVPGPDEVTRRPRGIERTARQGTQAPGSLTEGRPTAAFAFSRAHRLQSEAEFAAVARAGPDSIRLSQRWFVLMAMPVALAEVTAAAPRVRFGLTVGKKMARRAVDRMLVKRILREAARHAGPDISAVSKSGLDIVLRLKAPLPVRDTTTRSALKRTLREDADALLRRLRERLAAAAPQ